MLTVKKMNTNDNKQNSQTHFIHENAGLRLAFGHQARTGKDTSINYISRGYPGEVIRIAEPVYDISQSIQSYLNKGYVKNPLLLQLIGEGLRQIYTEDIWIDIATEKIKSLPEDTNIFIPDLRYKNEAKKLKELGFIMINVKKDKREIDRDNTHISEIDLLDYPFDYTIENNGTYYDLYNQLDDILEDIVNNNKCNNCTNLCEKYDLD